VTIDTCRADRISCYGAKNCETRAIDGVAERGVLFLDATAPAPLTLPSHASILTGLYPDRHTLRDNGAGRLPDAASTLAEVLAARGWRTAAFVSAVPVTSEFGSDQGFAVYDDELDSSSGVLPGDSRERGVVAERMFYEERIASGTADAALPWIRDAVAGDAPFFVWLHFFDPHAVYQPPPAQATRYGPHSYEGEIAFVDEQLRRILDALGDERDRVTVAVTADHGESLGDHGEQSHGLFVYESTLHVPWVMAGPGLPAGVRVPGPVSLVDVMPTLLDALGVPAPEGLDGRSRLEAARGGAVEEAPVFGECLLPRFHYDWAGLRSVRRGSWKLIDAPRPELYDLAADPLERRNLADARPEIVDGLRDELTEHAVRGGVLSADTVEVDPLVREQLDRLGYVGSSGGGEGDEDLWNRDGRDPKDMVDFYNRFQEVPTMMLDGREEEAAELLVELRDADPGNRAVLERIVMLDRTRERWEEMRSGAEHLLELDPGDAVARKSLAYALGQLGDAAGALREYRALVAADPGDADGWTLLGSMLSQEGEHAEAVRVLRHAVELAPDDAHPRATLARAWEDSGAVDAALADYDRALALDDGLREAVNGKALLLAHHGRPEEAVRVLREALPRVGQDPDTINNLAWLLVEHSIDPAEAWELAQHALTLAPDDAVLQDTAGWAAIRAGRPTDGIEPLENAWQATHDAEVRAHLGVALAESGRTAEGRAHVRAAVAERPDLASVPEIARWR
jgi:arylsulfatase A-like enzyme/Flp pilus assembly protein TadD